LTATMRLLSPLTHDTTFGQASRVGAHGHSAHTVMGTASA
jgi:hypothetical protein